MKSLFYPQNIAVIGASERNGSIGKRLIQNLMAHDFHGKIFPVSLRHSSIFNNKAYSSVKQIKEPIDLALVAVPACSVPAVIKDCGVKGIKSVIIISAGFRETGTMEGAELEKKIVHYARKYQIRIVGPNCIGVINPYLGLNASIARSMAQKGKVAFVSQSGAICDAILDWGNQRNIGFSYFISPGAMIDVNLADLILFLGDDPHTSAILLYLEFITDARSFLSACREVSYTKPIIVIKAGKTLEAAQSAASHTGSLTGKDAIFEAAFRRTGVLRVDRLEELFLMASVLHKQPTPKHNRLMIVTNAGGPAILATDNLLLGGGKLAELPEQLSPKLSGQLKEKRIKPSNPLDLQNDADQEVYHTAVEELFKIPENDGVLVLVTPQAVNDPEGIVKRLMEVKRQRSKPFLLTIMGAEPNRETIGELMKAGISPIPYPDTAAKIFNYMWKYAYNIKGIYETPDLHTEYDADEAREKVLAIIQNARNENRAYLTEIESKALLEAYDLPIVQGALARSVDQAAVIAEKIGYPVVLKVNSVEIAHKNQVGGIVFNLHSEAALRDAYQRIESRIVERFGERAFGGVSVQKMVTPLLLELIIGATIDEQFGPVLLFGNGGENVEVYKDTALALPPLNTTLAKRLMEQTRIYRNAYKMHKISEEIHERLQQILVRFSRIVLENPEISEIDINPIAVANNDLMVLDAFVALHAPDTDLSKLPPLAIRPYPDEYQGTWEMSNGEEVTVRPILPEDENLVIAFHKTLSDESVYMRYFYNLSYNTRISHERLARICFIDYDREMALVTLEKDEKGHDRLIGVGRLTKYRTEEKAEFAIIISDYYQGKGLGAELLKRLIEIGKKEQLKEIVADILPENRGMKTVCEKLGFQVKMDLEEQVLKAKLKL
ncbi:bifunctional acetate--CoA ligase family protein/GNAT family N-acetyltransferase [Rapidithrix thailandica]|uniref:Bifunctional acetate--CoA ligase family protein/GNAT family N-acetyltransferase n=1 Tax=Rapidithrix thailandica TaxID=413964 RepID=A0AAW9S6A5_9BACT